MSEYNFKGIKPESIELLCLNRFNDSKEFYEEHKLELKEGITVPMRQIVLDLSGLMYDIDDKMLTDPVRSVSRIYRDTRGNRSKIKYRENMWLMLRRYKKDMYPDAPKEIKPYLSAKNMEFSYSSFDINRINSPSLIDELKLAFDLARPMYSFWADAYDNMLDKGIIKPEDAIR